MVLGLLELGGSGHCGATLGVASATPPPDISSWTDGSTGPAGFLQVLPHAHPALNHFTKCGSCGLFSCPFTGSFVGMFPGDFL